MLEAPPELSCFEPKFIELLMAENSCWKNCLGWADIILESSDVARALRLGGGGRTNLPKFKWLISYILLSPTLSIAMF